MLSNEETLKIKELCNIITEKIPEKNLKAFEPGKPLLLVSQNYPGIWMEHAYDSVIYAKLMPENVSIAKNVLETFIKYQAPEGQFPCFVRDPNNLLKDGITAGYSQVQECVSFGQLCIEVYEMTKDTQFLTNAYQALKKRDEWFRKNRMTTNRGLVEMFVGFDTGHDNSGRLNGLKYPGFYHENGERVNRSVLPPDDEVAPILAVDMNCNFYANEKALETMANILNHNKEAETWNKKAYELKKQLIKLCYHEEDAFFYDVDKNGNHRKYLSSTIFHLFLERVLDPKEDKDMIEKIIQKHILNPNEFWTAYPFPAMAISDPSCEGHIDFNCWGYYSQALIALRCTRWMDAYGLSNEFDYLCERWLESWTKYYDTRKFGQELDPLTGVPTRISEWYSSCMLFYLYAAKRLRIVE